MSYRRSSAQKSTNWRESRRARVDFDLLAIEAYGLEEKALFLREIKRLRREVGILAQRCYWLKREKEDITRMLRTRPPPPIPARPITEDQSNTDTDMESCSVKGSGHGNLSNEEDGEKIISEPSLSFEPVTTPIDYTLPLPTPTPPHPASHIPTLLPTVMPGLPAFPSLPAPLQGGDMEKAVETTAPAQAPPSIDVGVEQKPLPTTAVRREPKPIVTNSKKVWERMHEETKRGPKKRYRSNLLFYAASCRGNDKDAILLEGPSGGVEEGDKKYVLRYAEPMDFDGRDEQLRQDVWYRFFEEKVWKGKTYMMDKKSFRIIEI